MQIEKPQKSLLQRQNSIWKSFLLLKLLEINWWPLKLLIDIRNLVTYDICHLVFSNPIKMPVSTSTMDYFIGLLWYTKQENENLLHRTSFKPVVYFWLQCCKTNYGELLNHLILSNVKLVDASIFICLIPSI